jgi:cell fate (sporulation/competence/biofilm development) regulator YlbF (YheA/YmcA/DUF963 family)
MPKNLYKNKRIKLSSGKASEPYDIIKMLERTIRKIQRKYMHYQDTRRRYKRSKEAKQIMKDFQESRKQQE